MSALVAAGGRLRRPAVGALPHVSSPRVRRAAGALLLAAGIALLAGPGWGLLLAGVLVAAGV